MGKKEKKSNNNESTVDSIQYYDITMNILFAMVSEPYYLFHFLTFFSYFSIRFSTSQLFSPQFAGNILHRELQALFAFFSLAVVKMVKEETWDGFVADMLLFAKIFLIGVALVVDYHLALWFMLTFLVIYLFTQQPAYMGLGSATQLTPLQLESLLTEGVSRFWLVEFRSSFSSTCIRTSRVLPELSITFSNKNISFGVVDLGLFPNTAGRFGISLGVPEQLPTYILFENAEEVSRFPEMHSVTKASSDITKKRLCRHFELDKHLLDYISGK